MNSWYLRDMRDYYHAGPELRKIYRDIWWDYIKLRCQCRFLRNDEPRTTVGKTVIIPGFRDLYLFKPKLDSMLMIELRRRGWRVKVLLSRGDVWQKRYYKAFGLNEFLYLDDVEITEEEFADCQRAASELMRGSRTIDNIKNWKYRNVLVGPSLLERFLKSSHGILDVKSDSFLNELGTYLPHLLRRVRILEAIMDDDRPDMLLVIDSILEVFLQLVDIAVARNVNVIHYYYLRDNVLGFKRLKADNKLDHPSSVSTEVLDALCESGDPNSLFELDRYFDDAYSDKWEAHKVLHQPGVLDGQEGELQKLLRSGESRKTAVIFSHLLWDHNMFYGRNLFSTFADWLIETVGAARKNEQVNWIIKLHPANNYRQIQGDAPEEWFADQALLKKKFGKLPEHIKFLDANTSISTLALMKNIDYGLTVRGTIGAELPCFGVPVLTAGSGRYSGLGFTIDSESKADYLQKVRNIHRYGRLSSQQIMKARWHAYALFKLCVWEMKSFRCDYKYFKSRHALSLNIRVESNSWRDIEANGDLRKWGDWAIAQPTSEYCDRSFLC